MIFQRLFFKLISQRVLIHKLDPVHGGKERPKKEADHFDKWQFSWVRERNLWGFSWASARQVDLCPALRILKAYTEAFPVLSNVYHPDGLHTLLVLPQGCFL